MIFVGVAGCCQGYKDTSLPLEYKKLLMDCIWVIVRIRGCNCAYLMIA